MSQGIKNESQMNPSSLYVATPMELSWENVFITASVEDVKKGQPQKKCGKKPMTDKVIISNSTGILRPGTFTALMGPSGSGKTTLLNFLSGRLYSQNLTINGTLKMNGKQINDIDKYSNEIAYVMQDDILLATFTPREAFMFVANMRLPNLTKKQKIQKVENLIVELGLTDASNTKIGNDIIRGVSGGERKRTSIGVELLTNPSMLFLDEPTTGLDSSTALQVIELLKHLSKSKGVNIVSTIHQPSSEIFAEFERLMLLVRGNIIYQGVSHDALDYFKNQGYPCPAYSNPSDFFMKLMNEEGLMIEKIQRGEELPEEEVIFKEFDGRLDKMITCYERVPKEFDNKEKTQIEQDNSFNNVGICTQFFLLIQRALRSAFRNPMDVKLKIIQSIVFSIACIIVFNDLGDDGYAAIQNRNGVLFFLITMQSFGSINGSISIFSGEKALFLRERSNKAYGVGPYYWSKSIAEIPFQILYPTIGTAIVYYAIGLNTEEWYKFPILVIINIATYFTGAAYGLLLSVIIPSLELAMALIPVVVIPLMVMGGFFVNSDNIPDFLKWIEYISMFKWGFQAAAINEFEDLDPISCGCIPSNPNDPQYLALLKKNPEYSMGDCIPIPCKPLEQHGFTETLWETVAIQFALGVALNLLALLGMYLISNPKRPVLNPPSEAQKKYGEQNGQGQIQQQ